LCQIIDKTAEFNGESQHSKTKFDIKINITGYVHIAIAKEKQK